MSNIAAFQAATRFGLGAKAGELASIGIDPRGWLVEQIRAPRIPKEVQGHAGAGLFMKGMNNNKEKSEKTLESIARKEAEKRTIRDKYDEQTGDRILAQIRSKQPFVERMVLFWSNHFTVSVQKGFLQGIVNQYEVEAIRPHVGGTFRDMLLAVCQHPAMLLYLDNAKSVGAGSKQGTRREKGLNENLAREILELHTLGVGSGYTQQDVIALANIVTGWTVNVNKSVAFGFNNNSHQPGAKTLLGKTFAENGQQEGIDALTMLARHPATANHIATKLVRHFVSDAPAPALIKIIADVFVRSDGHLPTVMQAVINLDEAWQSPLSKFKNSYEYVISVFRLTGVEPNAKQAFKSLTALNFRAFNAASPAGYDDVASAWASPDAVMKRVEWGYSFAQRLPANLRPLELAASGLGDALTISTRQSIERAASGKDGIALLLASPELQRR